MTYTERQRTQDQRSSRMGGRNENQAEAAGRPRHIRLDAPPKIRAVTAFGITALEPRHGQAIVALQLAAEGVERDTGASGEVVQILGDGLLIEKDGHDGPGGAVRHR